MSKGKFYYFSLGLLCLLFLQNSVHAQTPTPTPETVSTTTENIQQGNSPQVSTNKQELNATAAENLVHFGDLIEVDVVGSTEYDWRGKLNPEGFLSGINFIEEQIYGLCQTEETLAAQIAKGYSRLLKNPQVVVRILDRSGRPVSLLYGAVKAPQRFQIKRAVRLNELLILSGGITDKASGEIQIFRPPNQSCELNKTLAENQAATDNEPREQFITAKQKNETRYINIKIADLIKGSLEANPVVLSGDVVTVLEAEPIYVIGGVVNPKQINAHTQMTLSRAIAAAGGFTKDADRKKITVFRREKNGSKIIEIDFDKIKAETENDIVLQALDIVEVARTGREKRKIPPFINVTENNAEKSAAPPPLRIID